MSQLQEYKAGLGRQGKEAVVNDLGGSAHWRGDTPTMPEPPSRSNAKPLAGSSY